MIFQAAESSNEFGSNHGGNMDFPQVDCQVDRWIWSDPNSLKFGGIEFANCLALDFTV